MKNNEQSNLFYNRELSALEFNRRVLAMAQDPSVPLLERLRYITIVSSNLDEFFEVRVAGVQQRMELGLSMRTPDHLAPQELMKKIVMKTRELVKEQYYTLNSDILPALEEEGIRLLKRKTWSAEVQAWAKTYFEEQVLPVLTPLGLDPGHPFPNVQNKSLNFIVSLRGTDAFGRDAGIAILPVPRCLPRIISIPQEFCAQNDYVLLSSVIHAHVQQLFTGMEIDGCYQFRVTRNADMWVDEEEIDDLLTALKGELHGRQFGASIRLEVADNCPPEIAKMLLKTHKLNPELHLFQVSGPVNLHRLGTWVNILQCPHLKWAPYSPGVPEKLGPKNDIFDVIRTEDVLLHHPFRSFNPVVDMLWRVSEDPDILSVKMTLYRVGRESPITDALIAAARANKDVTVVVELRARFDEAANIRLAQKLTEAGAKIVYGIVNYKCHAKLMMIVRREQGLLRRYVHVGTGNYHINNARLYTDYSLLTSDPVIGEDVHCIFQQLTGLSSELPLNKILHAPFTLRKALVSMIENKAEKARNGGDAWIIAKMNSLTEASVIKALYRASQSGVKIQLIVRGICSLRPGIANVSENIEVRSVVGRFLEHHRCYIFSGKEEEKFFIASADWMDRNLHRRVEVCCPITDPDLQKRLKYEMELYLNKTKKTWVMNPDGSYKRLANKGIEAQEKLMRELRRK